MTSDLDALYYKEHSQPQYERAQEMIKSLKINNDACILDVGCGFGNITAELSQRVPRGSVIGLDASFEMIKLAKEKFPKSIFPNLIFQNIKAEEMFFEGAFFDAIVCFSCLLWVREPAKALDLMCRYLKPGGILLILTYLKESAYITFLEKTLSRYPSCQALSAAHTMLSSEEYKNVLLSHGFELEEFCSKWKFSRYEDKEALKGYLRGWLNCYVPLPKELEEEFLEQAANESLLVSTNPNEIVLPYQVLTIRARKPF